MSTWWPGIGRPEERAMIFFIFFLIRINVVISDVGKPTGGGFLDEDRSVGLEDRWNLRH